MSEIKDNKTSEIKDNKTSEVKGITKPHFGSRQEFATWRINELQKPQQVGYVNETIDFTIELFNAILGHFNNSGLVGNIFQVTIPFLIYASLFVLTIVTKYNFNIYRILALLFLYIISYMRLSYSIFMIIFLISLVFETYLLTKQQVKEEN